MGYFAAIAVDRRQNFILAADKLREMVGASLLIESSAAAAEELKQEFPSVSVVRSVSGELWLDCDNLENLKSYLWKLRGKLVEDRRLSVTFAIHPYDGQLDNQFRPKVLDLEDDLRNEKENRKTGDGTPVSPLFARCRVQADQPANHWEGDPRDDREPRRRLINRGSLLRLESSADYRKQLADRLQVQPGDIAEKIEHLAGGEGDSYIGFVKADVDGLGHVQMNRLWDEDAKKLGRRASELVSAFSNTVDRAVKDSAYSVMRDLLQNAKQEFKHFPFLPLVMAGDDLWVLCNRKFALPFAIQTGKAFARQAQAKLEGYLPDVHLSLSFGIAFTKVGFPIDQQLDLANQLLKNAKHARRLSNVQTTGYLDFFWLESSGRENLQEARRKAGGYHCPDDAGRHDNQYALFTRPWTLDETDAICRAAERLAVFPNGKLRLLERVLRLGGPLTALAMHQWWSHLKEVEQSGLETALEALPERLRISVTDLHSSDGNLPRGPWNNEGTALLELVEIRELLGLNNEEAK